MSDSSDADGISSTLEGNVALRPMIRRFVDHFSDYESQLRRAQAAQTQVALEDVTHKLKGAAGIHGFPLLAAHAESLEQAIREDAPDVVKKRLDLLIVVMNQIAAHVMG